MRVIAEKTKATFLIKIEMLIGFLMIVGAVVVLPVAVFSGDKSLLTNTAVWGFVLVLMFLFALSGFFGFVRPYFQFRNAPDVMIETDGTYLYIHGKKEGKIPLNDMKDADLYADLPYIMSREFIIHMLSEKYGKVTIKVPGYGKYKVYYVANAPEIPHQISALIGNRF